jgi:Tfp pilus assembly protein PilX
MLITLCPAETSQSKLMLLIVLTLLLLTMRKRLAGLRRVGENNQKKNRVKEVAQ